MDVGQLIGKIFCWCTDDDCRLRPLVVDCLFLSLDIAARHRQILSESASINDIEQIKRELTEDDELSYKTAKVSLIILQLIMQLILLYYIKYC